MKRKLQSLDTAYYKNVYGNLVRSYVVSTMQHEEPEELYLVAGYATRLSKDQIYTAEEAKIFFNT